MQSEEQLSPLVTTEQQEPQTDSTPIQANNAALGAQYEFHDAAIKHSIERYFEKNADELTAEDFETLSKLKSFSVTVHDKNVTTLLDLPNLFPELRYVSLAYLRFNEAQLSAADCKILEEMESLCAVDIYADGLPSLDFVSKLPYASLRYTEEAYLMDEYNLAQASVLGKDFIESQVTGHVKVNSTGGLILADVNFDGQKDILISQGHFGNQGLVTFSCLLNDNGTYKPNESFSSIANPSLDKKNKKILSTWRNWAASHSWAMYSYI